MQVGQWSDRKVEELIALLETNPAFFDDKLSLEFCIALKMRDEKLMFQIADDLSQMYLDGKANGNFAILEVMVTQYFQKYCVNDNARGIAEFLQLFLKDDQKTINLWSKKNGELIVLKDKVDSGSISSEEKALLADTVLELHDEIRQTRYFQNPEVYSYFLKKFFLRLKDFEDEYVKTSFEYFLNVSIPLSEKFYASGYIQEQTKIADLEVALNKKFSLDKSKQIGNIDEVFKSDMTPQKKNRGQKMELFLFRISRLLAVFMMLISFILVVGFLFFFFTDDRPFDLMGCIFVLGLAILYSIILSIPVFIFNWLALGQLKIWVENKIEN